MWKGNTAFWAWLRFQKNPISKATTLLLIHCFQPLAAWMPEINLCRRSPTPPPLSREHTFSFYFLSLLKWFNCSVRSVEAHRYPSEQYTCNAQPNQLSVKWNRGGVHIWGCLGFKGVNWPWQRGGIIEEKSWAAVYWQPVFDTVLSLQIAALCSLAS